jgi:hypothetical protein
MASQSNGYGVSNGGGFTALVLPSSAAFSLVTFPL